MTKFSKRLAFIVALAAIALGIASALPEYDVKVSIQEKAAAACDDDGFDC